MKFLFILLLLSSCAKGQITINGPGAGIDINGSGETVPVVTRQFFDAQTGDVDFEDQHFSFSAPGIAKTGYVVRNTMSYLEIKTIERQVTLKVGGNWANKLTQSYIPVLVDGVFNQNVSVTTDSVEEEKTIILPAGEKTVRIINGYNAAMTPFGYSAIYQDAGVFINGIITDTSFQIKVPTRPRVKRLFIGNSITTGASGTNPVLLGFPGLFRAEGWEVQSNSWGGRIVTTTTQVLADSFAVYVSAQMNGTYSNELFLTLGTNDCFIHNRTKDAFKTYYGLMLDALLSKRPDIVIYCFSIFNRVSYDAGNSLGYTGDDFYDALVELAATRPTIHVIYAKDFLSLANAPDQIHPNQTGMQQVHDSILVHYNLLNP